MNYHNHGVCIYGEKKFNEVNFLLFTIFAVPWQFFAAPQRAFCRPYNDFCQSVVAKSDVFISLISFPSDVVKSDALFPEMFC